MKKVIVVTIVELKTKLNFTVKVLLNKYYFPVVKSTWCQIYTTYYRFTSFSFSWIK